MNTKREEADRIIFISIIKAKSICFFFMKRNSPAEAESEKAQAGLRRALESKGKWKLPNVKEETPKRLKKIKS